MIIIPQDNPGTSSLVDFRTYFVKGMDKENKTIILAPEIGGKEEVYQIHEFTKHDGDVEVRDASYYVMLCANNLVVFGI